LVTQVNTSDAAIPVATKPKSFERRRQVPHLVHERRERDLASRLLEIAGCLDQRGTPPELFAATVEARLDRIAHTGA
jgi:hypothetical protein